jgi:clan AA aspartic protease (TIGR02281 family)
VPSKFTGQKGILPLLLLCLIGMSSIVWGKAFIWTDDEGIQYATDKEDAIPEKYRDRVKIILDPVKRSYKLDAPPEKTEVNFSRQGKTIALPGVLNGSHSVEFFLDTGSTDVLITEKDAQELGLDLTEAQMVQMKLADGKLVEVPKVTLESIRIGSAEVKNIPVVIGNVRLLGLSFLNNFRVVIDLERGKMTLSDY